MQPERFRGIRPHLPSALSARMGACAIALVAALAGGLVPGTALAEADPVPAVSRAREGSIWTVTDLVSFKGAKAEIEDARDDEGLTEATIVFTQDIAFDYDDEEPNIVNAVGRNYFSGIEGVTLTLTSSTEDPVTLTDFGATLGSTRLWNAGFNTNDNNARFFTGPLVLDNIKLKADDRDIFFAQGFPVTFTENFRSTERISVAGGCMGTNRKLDGVGFDGGYVQFGKDPSACPTSTHIEVYGGQFSAIYGGGYNSDVNGDTYVKVDLDGSEKVDQNRYDVHSVFGGGIAYGNSPSEGTRACVTGDSTVEVVSGAVGDIYGGGSNSTARSDGGAVYGDTYVTVGAQEGPTAYFSDVYGGGQSSTIGNYQSAQAGTGSTHVTVNATAQGMKNGDEVVANVHGGGSADTVKGTTEVVLNGGSDVNWVFAGGTNGGYQGTATVENVSREDVAARIVVNGGTWDEIYSCVRTFVGTGYDEDNVQKFNGDVLVEFNGGKVNQFVLSAHMSQIDGDSRLVVNEGTFGSSTPSIKGYRSPNGIGVNSVQYGRVTGTRSVSFTNDEPVVLWQIQGVDDIAVDNGSYALARGSKTSPALDRCGDLAISGGTFGITGASTLLGDLAVSEGGTLALNGKGENLDENGSLNAAGKATGAGELKVVGASASSAGWISSGMGEGSPITGEVYVRSMTTDETAENNSDANMLDLAEGEATKKGLYVEYTTDEDALEVGEKTYGHAWRIAQGEPPAPTMVTVTFDKNNTDEGSTEADPQSMEVEEGESVGTLPTPPERPGYIFTGWNTAPDGSGTAFTEETAVSASIKVYAQWEEELDLSLTLTPQDMVAYTGGDSMDGDNFPEVRYAVSASGDLEAALAEEGAGLKVLVDGTAVALSAEDAAVGEGVVIIPELGTEFTLTDTPSGDDEVAGVYRIDITGSVTAELSDGSAVDVEVEDDPAAKLTVRTVSNAGEAAGESGSAGVVSANPVTLGAAATGAQDESIATASVDEGAEFYTNGDVDMGLLGTDRGDPDAGALISLLFDDLLPSAGGTAADTAAALAARAGIDASRAEFKYLDLVNEHDGNAWVSTGSDVTVSWPVPEGVDPEEVEFTVYHFEGLHREYGGAGSPDAAEQIAACEVVEVPCEVVDGRVTFTLDGDAENGCFSPFALA